MNLKKSQIIQLRQIDENYRRLFESVNDPIVLTDLNGVVIALNARAARFLGMSRAELLGESLDSDWVPPTLRGLLAMLPAARQNDEVDQTLEVRSGDQDIKLTCRTRHITYGGDTVIQWLIQDQNQIVDLETQDEHIYMIVHDLKNPLSNVISSLELIVDTMEDPGNEQSLEDLVNIALRSSRRMELLVELLLDLKRIESGGFNLTTTTARLHTVLMRAVDYIKPSADRKNIPLSVNIASDLPLVLIDVNMIERVVVNLLENACKFVSSGQAVELSARRVNGNHVEITVRDEGPGIAPEDRPRLFQKFSRGSAAEKTQGSGLGLFFCKLAVEAHGGQIDVQSDGVPGHGTTFTVWLPIDSHS